MQYNFRKSLIAGQLGENRFKRLFPQMMATDGLTCDFISRDTNLRYEVKSESRSIFETPNVAIEISSSAGRRGALHNAKQYSDIIVFMFGSGQLFAYDIKKLFYWVRHNRDAYRHVMISNGSYNSEVVLVPRKLIAFLEVPIA